MNFSIGFSNKTSFSFPGFAFAIKVPTLDNYLYTILITVTVQTCNLIVAVFGIGANSVNIIIFAKQGFQERVNISLMGLAVSDLLSLVAVVAPSVLEYTVRPFFEDSFHSQKIYYLTTTTMHQVFVRVTSLITAFITLERCLCITLPLQVKNIFTRKSVTCFIISTYFIGIASVAPIYYTTYLEWVYFQESNHSYLTLTFTKDRDIVDYYTFIFGNLLLSISSLLFVAISTAFLIKGLQNAGKMLISENSINDKNNVISRKKLRIIKMTTSMAIIFIVTFTPAIVFNVWTLSDVNFNIGGMNRKLYEAAFAFAFLLESLNSSVLIFSYYNLSSRYKEIFTSFFSLIFHLVHELHHKLHDVGHQRL